MEYDIIVRIFMQTTEFSEGRKEKQMIRLFTDTSANLPEELIAAYHITVLPFSYTVNGETVIYPEEKDFDGKIFYEAMRNGADIKTSMVNMTQFTEAFEPCLKAGDSVLYIGMSGGISGTAAAAKMAVEELQEAYPKADIAAIDTLGASLGEGMQVLDAAKMIEKGEPFLKIVMKITLGRRKMHQFFTVDDLNYLRKGGRISSATAFVGNILNIKPILKGNENGEIVLCGKTRGFRKALDALAEKYAEMADDKKAPVGIAHADSEEGLYYLEDKLKSLGFDGELLPVMYEPVTGSHVGPGTVALFFYGD